MENKGRKKKDSEGKEETYLPLGMSMGMCFGMPIGMLFDNLVIGMCIGMCLGMAVGSSIKKWTKLPAIIFCMPLKLSLKG